METKRAAPPSTSVCWNVRPFVDGDYRSSREGRTFQKVGPADEAILYESSVGSADDVDVAVRAARDSFDRGRWSRRSPSARGDALREFADRIEARFEEFAQLDSLEMGKPLIAARQDARVLAPGIGRRAASLADRLLGEAAPGKGSGLGFNLYEPRGVIAAIAPWNFPVANAAIKVFPALAAGNSVILKPSELSPSSALKLAELAIEAGIPPGVFNVVPGLGTTVGEALCGHDDVDMVSFTGSTTTGKRVAALAGARLKPAILECGGKSPQLVFSDIADVAFVADAIVQSAFWNQGQVCSARTRVLVHRDVEAAIVEALVDRAKLLVPGDPADERTTFGPLASPAQRDRVKSYVDGGVAQGALLRLAGDIRTAGGCHVAPSIFTGVRADMAIAREEIFGPVLCVQSFADEAEALDLANRTDFGLSATLWTRDLGRALRLARDISVGSVDVRTGLRDDESSAPTLDHEPRKASGFGAESGLAGLKSYSTLKSVSVSGR